jgi:HAD superfamily hydrolase (TIGR01509 family)
VKSQIDNLNIKAVIFDMDGVIIDSEPFWRTAQINALAFYGATITEQECVQLTMGKRLDMISKIWIERHQLKLAPEVIANDIVKKLTQLIQSNGQALAGVVELLDKLSHSGYKIGLATSSSHRVIDAVLTKLAIKPYFDAILSADDEEYGKPHPAVYIRAAKTLGVSPQNCLVIEDSCTGLIAAKAASMTTLLVSPEAHEPQFSLADGHFNSLHEIVDLV